MLRQRCEGGLGRRAMAATPEVRRRLDDELGVIESLGYPSYFLTVADVVDLIRGMGVRVAARGSGAGSLVNYLLGISGVDPIRHGLLMERFLSPLREALPDVDVDVESARPYRGLRADPRAVRRRAGRLRLDDGHLPGAARDPRRRRRARACRRRDRPDRQGVPAHPGAATCTTRCASCPSCGRRDSAGASSTCCSGWSRGSTGCRGTSRCTRAGCCCPTPRCSTAPRSRRAGWASR
jgi:hypothetical protein